MWRSLFLAIGICIVVLGLESMALDKVVMNPKGQSAAAQTAANVAPRVKEIAPPDWAPWSLLSTGVVVILYTFTIPKRIRG